MKCQIHCPFCEESYELDEFPEGAHTVCEKCGQEFTIDMTVLGPGRKSTEPASSPLPKAARTAQFPPVLKPAKESSKGAQGTEEQAKKFNPPILATLFQIAAFLSGLAALILLFVVFSNGGADGSLFFFLGLLVNTFMLWGCAEIINHIGEIRFHAIRQTELLEIIAGIPRKK